MRFKLRCPLCGADVSNLRPHEHVCPPGATRPKQSIPELPPRHSKFEAYTSAGICSCGGNTPNCIYCDGTGLTSKDVRQHRDAIPTHGTATINSGYIPPSDEEPRTVSKADATVDNSDENVSPETTLAYEHPRDVTQMDKMRNYGYPCREDGRYGSHPSHDAFDDESKP